MIHNKQVCFESLVTVREYPMELGDNPSCNGGAPVQIGWEPQHTFRRPLLQEQIGNEVTRLSPVRRVQILLKAGCTVEQIGEAAVEIETIQKSRDQTATECKPNEDVRSTGTQRLTSKLNLVRFFKPIRRTIWKRPTSSPSDKRTKQQHNPCNALPGILVARLRCNIDLFRILENKTHFWISNYFFLWFTVFKFFVST